MEAPSQLKSYLTDENENMIHIYLNKAFGDREWPE